MKMQFILGNEGRKGLVKALSSILDTAPNYLGAPGFCYDVGGCIIDRSGVVEIPDHIDSSFIAEELILKGFERKQEETRFCISFPADGVDEKALQNLNAIIHSKASLIQKSLRAETLEVKTEDSKLVFDWFSEVPSPEEISAYSQFLAALINMAKDQQRVTAKPCTAENEKYAFRCFLLRLGFIGKEYSSTRKILLSRLYGQQSYKEIYDTKQSTEGEY